MVKNDCGLSLPVVGRQMACALYIQNSVPASPPPPPTHIAAASYYIFIYMQLKHTKQDIKSTSENKSRAEMLSFFFLKEEKKSENI